MTSAIQLVCQWICLGFYILPLAGILFKTMGHPSATRFSKEDQAMLPGLLIGYAIFGAVLIGAGTFSKIF